MLAKAVSDTDPRRQLTDVCAIRRATTRVAPTNTNAARNDLRLHGYSRRPPGCGDRGLFAAKTAPLTSNLEHQHLAPHAVIYPPCDRWRSGGYCRVNPSTTMLLVHLTCPQGTGACIHQLGDSRKNRPRAERRRSFWPFFFGERPCKKSQYDRRWFRLSLGCVNDRGQVVAKTQVTVLRSGGPLQVFENRPEKCLTKAANRLSDGQSR